jgi:LysM repeat protein
MDTISSRESSGSPLPLVGVIAGVLGLVLGIVALVKVSGANKTLLEHQPKIDLVDGIKATADGANDAANKANTGLATLSRSMQTTVNQIGENLGTINGRLDKLEEAQKKAAAAPAAKGGGPVVAGPNEYVIKPGDTFAKIARERGVSLADLQAVNAGVNPSGLKVGQKIKLPVAAKK